MKRRVIYRRAGKVVSDTTKEVSAEELAKLQEKFKRTHPTDVAPISGCCDPPESEVVRP